MATKSKNLFQDVFSEFDNLPFLFVGAGISKRYLGLPGWESLLRQFAEKVHPNNPLALEIFTQGTEKVDWPEVSTRIQEAYDSMWLTSPDYQKERKKHQESVKAGTSPFKLSLATYFSQSKKRTDQPHLLDELSCLTNVGKRSIAGLITTNYDNLLEEVFKDYATFIGQEPLLFAETQGIAEIYKIHGCCTQAESIVINAKDYEAFNKRNAYLAAKLLTVFVEHPIIFMGYSLSDPNVQTILAAITDCLSQKNLEILRKRLVFVEYTQEAIETPIIREHTINFDEDGHSLELTRITLNNFLPFYSELLSRKYAYNPKLLRQLKRDIYQLVTTNEPVDRFVIADIEDDAGLERYEVLAGVGVTGRTAPNGDRGHRIPEAAELFQDIIFNDGDFELCSLVENALAKLLKSHSGSLPIYKYLKAYRQKYGKEPPVPVITYLKSGINDFLGKGLLKQREQSRCHSLEELEAIAPTPEKKIELFPTLTNIEDNYDELGLFIKDYLTNHPDALISKNQSVKTNLKRIIKIYDFLKYGKEKAPETPSQRAN